ncbi:hypothetical protein ABE073_04985 [Lederbergia citrisecunda]|uniref:hypothetical protein n=1 Tax=Lederbergia citrisecunda TaxID=2833583 RepID=UPI003D27E413
MTLHYEINHFYKLESSFQDAEHKLEFFEEIMNEETSYWINAMETFLKSKGANHVAIKFTKGDLERLRDSINTILDK